MTSTQQLFLKSLALLVFSVLALGFRPNDQDHQDGKGAKIKLAERSYDFGEVDQGVIVDHVFKLTNVGDGVLRIRKLKGS